MTTRLTCVSMALLLASGTAVRAATAPAATAPAEFAAACSNAWIRGVTQKSPVGAAVGQDVVFSLALQGVTNAVPEGVFRYQWTRTGDDGATDKGFAPLTDKPFVYKTRSAQPGGIRFTAVLVDKAGKAVTCKQAGKDVPLQFVGGALAGAAQIVPPAEPAGFAAQVKDLRKQLGKPNLKKIPRTPVELPGADAVAFYTLELPSPTDHPVKGLLAIPKAATDGMELPCRLIFSAVGYEKPIPLPRYQDVRETEIVFTLAYDPGKPETRDAAFCSALMLQAGRAVQYLKTLPEWNGKTILTDGWGFNGLLALWTATIDEAVTQVTCGLVPMKGYGAFDAVNCARHLPDGCFVNILRAGLGDAAIKPKEVAAFWNALGCDRRIVWMQGSEGWSVPRNYKDRDTRWEKIRPVRYVNMDAEHAKIERGIPPPFANPEELFRDKIVLEIVFDYNKPADFDPSIFTQLRSYIVKSLLPVEYYGVIPEKKVRDKSWQLFRERMKKLGAGTLPFPVYVGAGMDIPVSGPLPCFRIVGPDGVLRYSGNDGHALLGVCTRLEREMPRPDPLFAYARPDLLKDLVDRLVEAKAPAGRIYRAIEAEGKKQGRKDPAVAEEAKHLTLAMHQAVERRLIVIGTLLAEWPGRAVCQLQELFAEWPETASLPKAAQLQAQIARLPDAEKLAKLERELIHINTWHPEKPSEIKKHEAARAILRKKIEQFTRSKVALVQGEAALMLAEIDNPQAFTPDGGK